jgi:hypothetical protein
MVGAVAIAKEDVTRKREEFEFAGNFFLVRIEGEEGSLERAYRSLTRLGITLPIEKANLSKNRNQRVNIKIIFHDGETGANVKFRDWIVEKVIPKMEQIKSNQQIKAKNNNFSNKETKTAVEISAVGNRNNVPVAIYGGKI